ncbi:MAG: NADPH-dependent F420 reductase [Armatimonadota bacterium]
MEIGIIGTGNMGAALAAALSRAGHSIMLGSRNKQRGRETAESIAGSVSGGSNQDAADFSDTIILAVPFDACDAIIRECGAFDGKTIIDITNPIDVEALRLKVDSDTSGGEEIAKLAPGAAVVKAFNMVHAEVAEDPDFGEDLPTCFYCGDDEDAKERVAGVIRDCGLSPVDCGPLRASRYLEATAGLIVQLSLNMGWGVDNALLLMER